MYKPLVGILLVNSNQKEWTQRVLGRLEEIEGVEVYLLDNGCVQAERFSRKELQLFEVPLVYERTSDGLSESAALGVLAAKAIEAGVVYVWLLAGLPEDERVLERMLLVAEQDKRVGVVGGGVRGAEQTWVGGWWWPLWLEVVPTGVLGGQLVVSPHHSLVRCAALEVASGFEERYFLGGFMVDLVYRLRRGGFSVEVEPKSLVSVEGEVSWLGEVGSESALSSYFAARNPFLWARLHLPFGLRLGAGVLHTVPILIRSVKLVLSGTGEWRSFLAGVRDGWGLLLG